MTTCVNPPENRSRSLSVDTAGHAMNSIFRAATLKVTVMTRIGTLIVAGLVIGLATLASSCTTNQRANSADFQYQPWNSRNPACSQGFRPTNALSCRY